MSNVRAAFSFGCLYCALASFTACSGDSGSSLEPQSTADGGPSSLVDGALPSDDAANREDASAPPPFVDPPLPAGVFGVVVEGARPLSETGGDDLSFRPHQAAAAAVQRPHSFPSYAALLEEGGFQSLRGLTADECNSLTPHGELDWHSATARCAGGNPFFDAWIDSCVQAGITPYAIVGSTPPSGISGTFDTWDAGKKEQYQRYLNALVEKVAVLSPTGISRFTFGNENAGYVNEQWLFTNPTQEDNWSIARFEAYREPSTMLWKAVQAARAAHPDKTIEFYGPNICYTAYWGGEYDRAPAGYSDGSKALEQYFQWAATQGIQLAGTDTHYYGDPRSWGVDRSSRGTLPSIVKDLKTWLAAAGHGTNVLIGEYGLIEPVNEPDHHEMYVDNRDAAQMVVLAREVMAAGGAQIFTLYTEDLAGTQQSAEPLGNPHLLHVVGNDDGSYTPGGPFFYFPKPSYAAGLLMQRAFTGSRRELAVTGGADVDGIVSVAPHEASALLYNWNMAEHYEDRSVPREVRVIMHGLPFGGARTAERYVIDAEHGNMHALLTAGTRLTPENTRAQLVESIPVTVEPGGNVVLPTRTMEASSVLLWLVR